MIFSVVIGFFSVAAFLGFGVLGRYNRVRGALYLFAGETLLLIFYIIRYALAESEISRVALAVFTNLQLFYIGLSICGWFVGRLVRQRALG